MATIEYREDFDPETGPDGKQGAERKAFSIREGEPAELVWRGLKDPGPVYQPYVVKAELRPDEAVDVARFRFRFLKESGRFGSLVHVVDLNDRRLVWKELPSTLHGISFSSPCAFLFFSDDLRLHRPDLYRDGHKKGYEDEPGSATRDDNGTGGNGKWPRGAGRGRSERLDGLLARATTGKLTAEDIALLQSLGAT